MLRITCFDVFKVTASDGTDITPSSEKARAVIILLALSSRGERRRAWLQDKLWSTKTQEKGGQSLRQALSDIRRSFGEHAAHLTSDRRSVRLSGVELEDPGNLNLVEIFDVGDIEFERWAHENATQTERTHEAPVAAPARAPLARTPALRVAVLSTGEGSQHSDFLRRSLVDQIALTLAEHTAQDSFVFEANEAEADLVLDVETQLGQRQYGFRVTWRQMPGGHRLWSNARAIPIDSTSSMVDSDGILQLAYDAAAGLLAARRKGLFGRHISETPPFLALDAVSKIFTFDASVFQSSDESLSEAFEAEGNAVHLAWRAMLRNMQIVERHGRDPHTIAEEAQEFARKALERDPSNSLVKAIASNTFLITSTEVDLAMDLAQAAVQINPSNPLAWDALGLAAIHAEDPARAHDFALRAKTLGGSGFLKPWLDMAVCLTSVSRHDTETAYKAAKMSHLLLPNFRPPLRYLTVLSALHGREEEAAKYCSALGALEPDFSIHRLIEDTDYPLAAYRASGLPMDHLRQIA